MKNKTTRTLPALIAAFALMGTAQAAPDIFAAWDLNEGSGTTTTQYQRDGMPWNQVTNPEENLAATDSENFSAFASWSGAASPAPNSTDYLNFNGTGGVNQMNTNVSGAGLSGTGAKTFLAWINPTALDSTGAGIISYSPTGGATNGSDLRLVLNPSGLLRVEVNGSGFATGSSLVNGGWKMVAAVFDNTNGTSIYVGGSGFVANQSLSFNTAATASNNGILDIVIGGTQVETRSFTGGIDMAAVYTGALTESELDSIYTSGVAIPEPGTLVLFAFAAGYLLYLRRRC